MLYVLVCLLSIKGAGQVLYKLPKVVVTILSKTVYKNVAVNGFGVITKLKQNYSCRLKLSATGSLFDNAIVLNFDLIKR